MRECGACTLCCTLIAVKELKKKRNQRCFNLEAKGCAIYDYRPRECRAWSCGWLVGSDVVHGLERPDKSHFIVDTAWMQMKMTMDNGNTLTLLGIPVWVDPKHPEVRDGDEIKAFARRQAGQSRIVIVDGKYMLVPPDWTKDKQSWGKVPVT
jgi:hypothetical protein